MDALDHLQTLPVTFIIRLCTDDVNSIHFWQTLELDFRNLDIVLVDDFEAEAEEIYTANPWINYCMPLQRAREWGFQHKVKVMMG